MVENAKNDKPQSAVVSFREAARQTRVSAYRLRIAAQMGYVATISMGRRLAIPRSELERLLDLRLLGRNAGE